MRKTYFQHWKENQEVQRINNMKEKINKMKQTKKTDKKEQTEEQEGAGVYVAPVELLRTKPAKTLAEAYKGRPIDKTIEYIDLGVYEE
tara:strand:- start:233 stop:496 length:264 start_codon:yes stop_codon:yes gene_type:complete